MQVATEARGGWALLFAALGLAASFGGSSTVATRELQTAVTRNGFLVAEPTTDGINVIEVTRAGNHSNSWKFPQTDDVRFAGTRQGVLAVYQDGKRIRLTRVSDGADGGMFGTNVKRVCEGVASNEQRFGVGWLERDDAFWFVHGPVSGMAAEATPLDLTAMRSTKDWCGIASAEDKIALLWREGDRLFINRCTAKKCGGMPGATKLPKDALLLGVGCLRTTCLVATRTRGMQELQLLTESGSVKWRAPLQGADTAVSIVGVGDRAFAVGAGDKVLRVDKDGKTSVVWQGTRETRIPHVAWADGRLLVTHAVAGAISIQTVELAR